jgi:hypothetical protein
MANKLFWIAVWLLVEAVCISVTLAENDGLRCLTATVLGLGFTFYMAGSNKLDIP